MEIILKLILWCRGSQWRDTKMGQQHSGPFVDQQWKTGCFCSVVFSVETPSCQLSAPPPVALLCCDAVVGVEAVEQGALLMLTEPWNFWFVLVYYYRESLGSFLKFLTPSVQ